MCETAGGRATIVNEARDVEGGLEHPGRDAIGGRAVEAGALSTEAVWLEVSGRLRRFIAARVRNRDDAEDVLQDVFVKIHDQISRLEDPARLHAWVYQITRNAIVDYYRRRSRAPELVAELPEDLAADDSEEDLSPEVAAWLAPMIETLPPRYRDALLLSEVQGLTQQETAGRLGLSLSGAKSRVQRGRERLRETLLACCHVELDRAGRVVEWRSRRPDCASGGCDPAPAALNSLASIAPRRRLPR
jgi:RNA polymerase sigma-70 factor (ECF subfamily)